MESQVPGFKGEEEKPLLAALQRRAAFSSSRTAQLEWQMGRKGEGCSGKVSAMFLLCELQLRPSSQVNTSF